MHSRAGHMELTVSVGKILPHEDDGITPQITREVVGGMGHGGSALDESFGRSYPIEHGIDVVANHASPDNGVYELARTAI